MHPEKGLSRLKLVLPLTFVLISHLLTNTYPVSADQPTHLEDWSFLIDHQNCDSRDFISKVSGTVFPGETHVIQLGSRRVSIQDLAFPRSEGWLAVWSKVEVGNGRQFFFQANYTGEYTFGELCARRGIVIPIH